MELQELIKIIGVIVVLIIMALFITFSFGEKGGQLLDSVWEALKFGR